MLAGSRLQAEQLSFKSSLAFWGFLFAETPWVVVVVSRPYSFTTPPFLLPPFIFAFPLYRRTRWMRRAGLPAFLPDSFPLSLGLGKAARDPLSLRSCRHFGVWHGKSSCSDRE